MGEKHHYVACIDLEGRSVLVVGAGRVAHEKVSGLLDCGAVVSVVAPEISAEVAALDVELLRRRYRRLPLRPILLRQCQHSRLVRRLHPATLTLCR